MKAKLQYNCWISLTTLTLSSRSFRFYSLIKGSDMQNVIKTRFKCNWKQTQQVCTNNTSNHIKIGIQTSSWLTFREWRAIFIRRKYELRQKYGQTKIQVHFLRTCVDEQAIPQSALKYLVSQDHPFTRAATIALFPVSFSGSALPVFVWGRYYEFQSIRESIFLTEAKAIRIHLIIANLETT